MSIEEKEIITKKLFENGYLILEPEPVCKICGKKIGVILLHDAKKCNEFVEYKKNETKN